MTHSTEVVSYKKLSNGQFSVCIRCCGNQSTDHWHTVNADDPNRMQSIADAHTATAKEHEAALKSADDAVALMGQTVEHNLPPSN